jgi:hypothetical protein
MEFQVERARLGLVERPGAGSSRPTVDLAADLEPRGLAPGQPPRQDEPGDDSTGGQVALDLNDPDRLGAIRRLCRNRQQRQRDRALVERLARRRFEAILGQFEPDRRPVAVEPAGLDRQFERSGWSWLGEHVDRGPR